jgi:hypothetical protein
MPQDLLQICRYDIESDVLRSFFTYAEKDRQGSQGLLVRRSGEELDVERRG